MTKFGMKTATARGDRGVRPPSPGLAALGKLAVGGRGQPTYALLPEIARRFGDVVDIPIPAPRMTMTLLSHPDHVDHIMTRHHDRYPKHESTRALFWNEPEPLPLLNGQEWKSTRRSVSGHFTEQSVASVGAQLVDAITGRVSDWSQYTRSSATVDLEHAVAVVVMDGLMRSMFSETLPLDKLDRLVHSTKDYARYSLIQTATYWLPDFIPRPFARRGEAAKTYLFGQLDDMIARRRGEQPRGVPDVLDVLLDLPVAGSASGKHGRVRAELAALVLAGVETTASAVAWTVALLAGDSAALGRACAEIDDLGTDTLEYGHIQQLAYLRCCFDEAQRIQSSTPVNIRTAREDDEIGGYFIPAGSHVLISPYGLHRDPRFWTDPEEFRPSRFTDDKINRNAFVPFNIGPRKCLGLRVAYAEALLTLTAILKNYRVLLTPGWQPRPELRGSTGLAGGLPVTLRQRQAP